MWVEKTAFILNPAAAGGRSGKLFQKISNQINSLYPERKVLISDYPGHASELARKLAHEGTDQIIGCGGDGTFNQIVNGLFENRKAIHPNLVFGTLPMGTGSDFIRTLMLPKDLNQALQCLKNGRQSKIDVGCAAMAQKQGSRDQYFLNILSCGLSAEVANQINNSSAPGGSFFRYMSNTILGIAKFKNKNISIRINDSVLFQGPFSMLAIANGRYFGGGMLVAPQAKVNDGKFQVVIIKAVPKLRLLARFPSIYSGKHLKYAETLVAESERVEASSTDSVLIESDGESPGALPLKVDCLKQSLNMIVGPTF